MEYDCKAHETHQPSHSPSTSMHCFPRHFGWCHRSVWLPRNASSIPAHKPIRYAQKVESRSQGPTHTASSWDSHHLRRADEVCGRAWLAKGALQQDFEVMQHYEAVFPGETPIVYWIPRTGEELDSVQELFRSEWPQHHLDVKIYV